MSTHSLARRLALFLSEASRRVAGSMTEGEEADVLQWGEGCSSRKDVNVWTVGGVDRAPIMGDGFQNNGLSWLLSR